MISSFDNQKLVQKALSEEDLSWLGSGKAKDYMRLFRLTRCCSLGQSPLTGSKLYLLIWRKEKKSSEIKTEHEDLIDDILYNPYSREDKDLREKRLHLSFSELQNKAGV